jgi:hypothetical protein
MPRHQGGVKRSEDICDAHDHALTHHPGECRSPLGDRLSYSQHRMDSGMRRSDEGGSGCFSCPPPLKALVWVQASVPFV